MRMKDEDIEFCPRCGTPLEGTFKKTCPKCGYCVLCG